MGGQVFTEEAIDKVSGSSIRSPRKYMLRASRELHIAMRKVLRKQLQSYPLKLFTDTKIPAKRLSFSEYLLSMMETVVGLSEVIIFRDERSTGTLSGYD